MKSRFLLGIGLSCLIAFSACDKTTEPDAELHPAFAEFDADAFTIYTSGNNVIIETTGLPLSLIHI